MSRLPAGIQPTGNTTYIVPKTVLKVEGLVKIYGQRRVVDGVSFDVNKGEVVGLLGPNGAGKTTSFRMTCGLIDANAGVVFLNGKDVTNWPLYRRAREGGMGYLPQAESVFRQLSVQDNLLGMMEMLGINAKTRHDKCDLLLQKLNLTHLRKNLARGLSGGERRRLEIARALVSDPKIILLDEPFANIDPITVQSIQKIIQQLSAEGISILITDHQVRETLQITHRSYVIQAGKVLCYGTPAEVLANEAAQKAYFGQPVGGLEHLGHHVPGSPHLPITQKSKGTHSPRDKWDAGWDEDESSKQRPVRSPIPKYGLNEKNSDGEREPFSSSRQRPSVKIRRGERQQGSAYDGNLTGNSTKDSTEDRDTRRSMKYDNEIYNDESNEIRPPKYSSRHKSERHYDSGPYDGEADEQQPVPRVSLLGRISGIFKKPSE
ncbi:MAG: LPS export ABC transporter ATP-binding protein [Planctomycetaceae bacterium]|nr:LPS export ABC transporter ATP-binding protein [Planctomycetaceae bacterium]